MSAAALAQTELIEAVERDGPRKHVLDNGLIVIIKEDRASPLVAMQALVGAGSTTEAEFAGSGISHFVEHMLFKGTDTKRVGQIEKEIKSFGGTINGFTSHDYTGFQIVVPKEHSRESLAILKDALFNSSLDPHELENERGVILKEIRLGRDSPMKYLSRLLWSTVYRTHPYRYPVIGYESLFLKLTRDDLVNYYKRMYIPNNIVLAVVGDVDAGSAYVDVYDIFGDVERGILPDTQKPIEDRQLSKRALEKREDINLAHFGLGFRSVDIFKEDLFALDVLAIVLGEGVSSRLNQTLYMEKELVYSVGAWNYTPKDPGTFLISGITDSGNVEKALNAIWEEIDKIKKDGISEEELLKAKNSVLSSYISSRETVSGQASDLASSELIVGDYNFSKRYLEGVESVNENDIQRVASDYLSEDGVSVAVLLPQSAQRVQPVRKDRKNSKYRIQKFALPNGMKVLLREDRRLPLVSIKAFFNGGLRTENKTTNGICNLTAAMLLKGTDSRTEEQISETIESRGGSISYISGNNSFGISLKLLSRDMDTGLELTKDIIFSSSIPRDILQREKNSVLAAIKSEEDDIYKFGMKLLRDNLFQSHPYRFTVLGSMDSVQDLDREEIVNYYNKRCQPNNMVLAVFGDIETDAVLAKIKEEFSGLKKGITPALSTRSETRLNSRKEIYKTLNKAQSVVMIGFRGVTIYDKDKYTLAVIGSILSGKNGRLSMRLREKLGISYALGSFSTPAVDPGYFIFYVGTSAPHIPRVKKELLRQIKLLVGKYITDEELDLAKRELAGKHKISIQTNAALAFRTGLDELYGLGYEDYLKFTRSIESVTREDILRVSNKYFSPDLYTMVVVEGKQ